MARALQCPDCGHRHPLDGVGDARTFRCAECNRLLKVPASVAAGAGQASEAAADEEEDDGLTADDPDDDTRVVDATTLSAASSRTRVPPSKRGNVVAEQARSAAEAGSGADGAPVPRLVRAAIWLAALPIGLVPVLVAGRTLGFFSVDRALDVFIGIGIGRFVPLVIVIIPWALVTATIAHVGIEGITRMRDSWRVESDAP